MTSRGYAGQAQTPVFNAAFAGEAGIPLADYGNTSFMNDLTSGQVEALANVLAGANYNPQYFCNLAGSSFKPCAPNAGFTGKGAGYPINYFQLHLLFLAGPGGFEMAIELRTPIRSPRSFLQLSVVRLWLAWTLARSCRHRLRQSSHFEC